MLYKDLGSSERLLAMTLTFFISHRINSVLSDVLSSSSSSSSFYLNQATKPININYVAAAAVAAAAATTTTTTTTITTD